jgi:hypothetical protein
VTAEPVAPEPEGTPAEPLAPKPESAPVEPVAPEPVTGPVVRDQAAQILPEIRARLPLRDKTALALAALAALPVQTVALHNDRLCRVRRGTRGARIEPHSADSLRGVMARCCRFTSVPKGKDGDVHEIDPPDSVVADALSLRLYPDNLRQVSALVETPLILSDGRVLTQPGFDEDTGIYLWPESRLQRIEVPERPTGGDVRAALGVLNDIIADMPFVDLASRANFMAFWFTPIVSRLFEGRSPALVIDAPQQGSGKSLATGIIAITATGRAAAAHASAGRDEELRKVLTANLRRGAMVIAVDNITHTVNQPSLAAFLTGEVWTDRILGATQMEDFTNNALVILNGCNVFVGGDLQRRCFFCRMDPEMSRPWERRGFLHDPLLPYVKAQRPVIVRAILTLARGWIVAGSPDHGVPVLGSFSSWCSTVGNILAFAGVEGFLQNRFACYEAADEEASEFDAFLRQWYEDFGSEPVAVRDVISRLDPDDIPAALNQGQQGNGSVVKRLAKMLARYERRRFGIDNIFVASTPGASKTKRWQVRKDATS